MAPRKGTARFVEQGSGELSFSKPSTLIPETFTHSYHHPKIQPKAASEIPSPPVIKGAQHAKTGIGHRHKYSPFARSAEEGHYIKVLQYLGEQSSHEPPRGPKTQNPETQKRNPYLRHRGLRVSSPIGWLQ